MGQMISPRVIRYTDTNSAIPSGAAMVFSLVEKVRSSHLWTVGGVLPRAGRWLACVWWTVLVLRGLLPAVLAIAMGFLVGAVQNHPNLRTPLAAFGSPFLSLSSSPPL